jgi:hypothetical protein
MRCSIIGLMLTLIFASGCGPGDVTLAGTVTYQGKPVVYGTVGLVAPGQPVRTATLTPEGRYTLSAPQGDYKVSISSPPPPGVAFKNLASKPTEAEDQDKKSSETAAAVPPDVVKAWIDLPQKYNDPNQSGIVLKVIPGANADISLN